MLRAMGGCLISGLTKGFHHRAHTPVLAGGAREEHGENLLNNSVGSVISVVERSIAHPFRHSRSNVLLPNPPDTDILPSNMNVGFALTHHHAHFQSLEDRAIPLCIPV